MSSTDPRPKAVKSTGADLLLSERLGESRSVCGLLLCSARSMAILMSSTHRSISDPQLERGDTQGECKETRQILSYVLGFLGSWKFEVKLVERVREYIKKKQQPLYSHNEKPKSTLCKIISYLYNHTGTMNEFVNEKYCRSHSPM